MSKLKAKKIIDVINKGIALNPTEIEIKELKKGVVDGALEDSESKKNLEVLIYLENSSNNKVIIDSQTRGTSYKTSRYKMIANKDADIEVNPKNAIEFNCIEGHMKIKEVYPIVIEKILCGYECDLERID
ncbi:hypothetical protein [Clostridium botulinum]|uniref:hypothetical protein n=1 Tax=Clostridium botulinum TaxID=1491 RepID=UPI0004D3FC4D|nr:hypothetical protein [Clostridium botulinum]KEH96174.1 hypothetical protein Z953_p0241 [Clostridium botulinum D str. 16868]MCD3202801.1 hypothetical protein [Clostridium botulinum C/D]MCD3230827.1 hypothetical protein [Clostridium botulinum C/D]MCD3253988.1 hypothetical protein [Clostridium botulinum C/D]MCD3279416.1 hypothetical protein [Clostridium botulinum C/D]